MDRDPSFADPTFPSDPTGRLGAHPIASATVETVSYTLHTPFSIARGTQTVADAVRITIDDGDGHRGRGECNPIRRYGEDAESTAHALDRAIETLRGQTVDATRIADLMPPGSARNALDCALWDLACKRAGTTAHELVGAAVPTSLSSLETVILGTPDEMRESARSRADRPVLKIKLDADDVEARVRAVREGAPNTRLVVDGNESWTLDLLQRSAEPLAELGIEMIEQPLRAGDDAALEAYDGPVPICADESVHTRADLPHLRGRYALINIKLDKAGGLTEALLLAEAARGMGFDFMVGCMVCSSLAIAPAVVLASCGARYSDLDGPTWLADDVEPRCVDAQLQAHAPTADLWG